MPRRLIQSRQLPTSWAFNALRNHQTANFFLQDQKRTARYLCTSPLAFVPAKPGQNPLLKNTRESVRAWTTSPANTGDFVPHSVLATPGLDHDTVPTTASQPPAEMASDEEYAAFLNKASDDLTGSASTQSKTASKGAQHTRVTTAQVPDVLHKVDAIYESDADEPFEPVSLKRTSGKGALTVGEVKELIGAQGSVKELSTKDFDPKGRYNSVLDAVEQASGKKHDVKVFSVEAGGARVEYWVLSVADSNDVVGLKAVAVES